MWNRDKKEIELGIWNINLEENPEFSKIILIITVIC